MNKAVLLWLLNRFREPSTWASVSVVLTLLGIHIDGETWQAFVGFGAASAAFLGVLLREKPELPSIQLVGHASNPPADRVLGATVDLPPRGDDSTAPATDYPPRSGWNG